jgi:hypothetical protein
MKKRILRVIAAVILLYAGWLVFETATFHVYRSDAGTAGDPREIEGVYHIHSTLSDGRGTVESLATTAAREKLDFLILADHGSPNFPSLASQGLKSGVVVLSGSELSSDRGHLVALGFRTPDRNFSRRTEEAVLEIQALGGFAIIAHPYSKVKWSWGDSASYAGLEILNADSMFMNNIKRVLPYAPLLLFKSRLPLIKMLEHPEINLKKWDLCNSRAPVFGYFSADAHLYYQAIFSLLHLHLLLDEPLRADFEGAAGQIYGALRKGRFYNAVEGAAKARGFRFEAAGKGRSWSMGDTISSANGVTFSVVAPFSFSREIRLLRNGRTIAAVNGESLKAAAEGPGTYRAEVFLRERSPLGRDIPWIVSNPIFIGKD